MRRTLLGFVLMLGLQVAAQENAPETPPVSGLDQTCTYYYKTSKAFHYYRDETNDGVCYLNIVYNLDLDMVYRAYLFSNNGMFMVFNSYGPGENSNSTGARVYYFFPRERKPHGYETEKGLEFETSSNRAAVLTDKITTRVLEITGSKFVEADKVTRTNKGGLEILSHHSLWLDLGFAMGQDPSMKPNAPAIFRDENNASCTVKMNEIHNYPPGDVNFKFNTDKELATFLKKRCPNLSLATL